MKLSIDQQIDAAHAEAERIENEALQIEARIEKLVLSPFLAEAIQQWTEAAVAGNLNQPARTNESGVGHSVSHPVVPGPLERRVHVVRPGMHPSIGSQARRQPLKRGLVSPNRH